MLIGNPSLPLTSPFRGQEDTSEAWTHPGMANSHNYWYVKFDLYACFDLEPFSALQFDLLAPSNAEMTFVMTQKAANCSTRLIDSQYQPLSKYMKPDGTKKTLVLPLADFGMNVVGGRFDMKHLKDFTIIDIKPNDFKFQISNMILKGACSSDTAAGTNQPSTPGAKASATKSHTLWSMLLSFLFFPFL